MARIKISKEKIDTFLQSRTLVDPAWYRCRISKHETRPSKKDKSTTYRFTFTVIPAGHPEHDANVGRQFLKVFSEKFMEAMGPMLEALGAKVGPDGNYDVDPDACVGKEIDVYVKRGKNQDTDEATNEVADFKPLEKK
jgi:hypothetical protein